MATNIESDIATFIITIPAKQQHLLGAVRHWDNLKIATLQDTIYIKDATAMQVGEAILLTIPNVKVYLLNDNLLFEKAKLVPTKKMPTGLLFTPIGRAITVQLPKQNFHFFGITKKVKIEIVQQEEQREARALLVDMATLQNYVATNSAIRIQGMQWVIVNNMAFIIGNPMLPLQGKAYWQSGYSFLPLGYNFALPTIQQVINTKLSNKHFIIWDTKAHYVTIEQTLLTTLTLASIRKSIQD